MEDHRRADVVIVGGAAIGASIAYFIKAVIGSDLGVIVIERDPVFRRAATPCRQLPSANNSPPLRISAYRASALRSCATCRAGMVREPIRAEGGYLILASVAGLSALGEDVALQRAEGAAVALLDPVELAARFPCSRSAGSAAERWVWRARAGSTLTRCSRR